MSKMVNNGNIQKLIKHLVGVDLTLEVPEDGVIWFVAKELTKKQFAEISTILLHGYDLTIIEWKVESSQGIKIKVKDRFK